MEKSLSDLYKDIVIKENVLPDMKVKGDGAVEPGPLPGAEKKMDDPNKNIEGVKKPEEDEKDSQPKDKKEEMKKESKNLANSFEELYQKIISEEEEQEVVSAEDIESDDWDSEEGDFADEDVEEEVDLASELRLMADRLVEIADKISFGEEEPGEEVEQEEEEVEEAPEEDLEKVEIKSESLKIEEPKEIKTDLGPKMSQVPKNSVQVNSGKAKSEVAKKERKGKAEVAPKTTRGPQMSQKQDAEGPMGNPGSKLFG